MAITGKTAKIEDALFWHLGQLTLSPTRRVAWPDKDFTPAVGETYLAPGVLWNASQRGEIGRAAARRHVGIFQVLTKGPISGSSVPQIEVADAVIEHFDLEVIDRNSLLVRIGSFDGGRSVPWRNGAVIDNGWRLIAVSIPFWCDAFPS